MSVSLPLYLRYTKLLLIVETDFGFMDGISQPGITGFTANPVPGQIVIDPGHILLGETGDATPRPAWAQDGSFLAFRQLKQLVPEFEQFLTDNPIIEPGLTLSQGSALMGARMVGRWKSVSSSIRYPPQTFISCMSVRFGRVLQLIFPRCSMIPSLQRILNATTTLRLLTQEKISYLTKHAAPLLLISGRLRPAPILTPSILTITSSEPAYPTVLKVKTD